MTAPSGSRREFVKRGAYVAPAILTLAAAPEFAKAGSVKPGPSNGHGHGRGRDRDDDWRPGRKGRDDDRGRVKRGGRDRD